MYFTFLSNKCMLNHTQDKITWFVGLEVSFSRDWKRNKELFVITQRKQAIYNTFGRIVLHGWMMLTVPLQLTSAPYCSSPAAPYTYRHEKFGVSVNVKNALTEVVMDMLSCMCVHSWSSPGLQDTPTKSVIQVFLYNCRRLRHHRDS